MSTFIKTITSKKFLYCLLVILFSIICILSIFLFKKDVFLQTNNKITHDGIKYKFTSPILDCEAINQGDESVVSYSAVSDFVKIQKLKYNIDFISVYFRDLNNGPWVGINEKEFFSPASLLKVPLLISFLKYAEDNPKILTKKVIVSDADRNNDFIQYFKPSVSLQPGQEYNLEEVAEHMIKYSDNIGMQVLSRYVPQKYLQDVYTSIGVDYTSDNTDLGIRIKDYSAFFRVLFNSSYLNRDMSEKALGILSQVEYKNGLVSGVPSDILVAHKFGERSKGDLALGGILLTGEVQLHDCGVIYYPNRPYILCIMTRGNNFENQQNSIKDISNFFYNKIADLHNR